ncbi:MAG: energy transducer TonB, partial [Deinococcales bacterium]|nr:energy transducer TonB [Chitinophagaceae bacterium]
KAIVQPKPQSPIAQVAVNIPIITPDKLVASNEVVKSIDEVENIRIGASTIIGDKLGEDIITPPTNTSVMGIGNDNKAKEIEETIAITVEIVAQFPGGLEAWKKYLEKNLNAGIPAENGAQSGKYTVLVSFVVNNEGNISEVKAENNPGFGTEAEAIRIIKKGPKWQPAIQNGRKVAYRVKQQVTFLVNDNE